MGQVLKQNDLVRYHIRDLELDSKGFVIGQYYQVKESVKGQYIEAKGLEVYLEDVSGLTQYADNFTLHACPVTLPIGQAQRRLYGL